jgi:6-pyruvoyl-tetrahydropterin synthase
MKTLTGVGAIFCAAHRGEGRRDVIHGHSYEVTAWFAYDGQDAEALQEKLFNFLRCHLDHTTLRDPCAEDVARMVLQCLGAERVEVRRPLERLYAEVSR